LLKISGIEPLSFMKNWSWMLFHWANFQNSVYKERKYW